MTDNKKPEWLDYEVPFGETVPHVETFMLNGDACMDPDGEGFGEWVHAEDMARAIRRINELEAELQATKANNWDLTQSLFKLINDEFMRTYLPAIVEWMNRPRILPRLLADRLKAERAAEKHGTPIEGPLLRKPDGGEGGEDD